MDIIKSNVGLVLWGHAPRHSLTFLQAREEDRKKKDEKH